MGAGAVSWAASRQFHGEGKGGGRVEAQHVAHGAMFTSGLVRRAKLNETATLPILAKPDPTRSVRCTSTLEALQDGRMVRGHGIGEVLLMAGLRSPIRDAKKV